MDVYPFSKSSQKSILKAVWPTPFGVWGSGEAVVRV